MLLVSAETMFPMVDVFQKVSPYIDSDGQLSMKLYNTHTEILQSLKEKVQAESELGETEMSLIFVKTTIHFLQYIYIYIYIYIFISAHMQCKDLMKVIDRSQHFPVYAH